MDALAITQDTTPVTSTDDLINAFLSGRSPRTVDAYRRDLQDFADFLGVHDTAEAARVFLSGGHGRANLTALNYVQALQDRGLQPTTINRRLAALRSLTEMGRTIGLISWKLEAKNLKTEPYRDTRGPGLEGFKRMLNITKERNDCKGARDFAILRLLFDLGLRRGEVVALDVADVDLAAHTIDVMGKGRSQKSTLTLSEPTSQALSSWFDIRGTEPGPLFTNCDRAQKGHGRLSGTSVYRLVRSLGEKIGVKTRPHGIRHSAITTALQKAQANGIDLEAVLDFSRHADVKTMMMYRDRERDIQGKLSELVADSV